MPAIISHHIFGEDAAALLPPDLLGGQEELLAFLLGSQGPDPLFARFRALPRTVATCSEIATRMHEERVVEALVSLRDSVASLPADERGIGRAFALGMAAHYLLDSMAHPLIYAQQEGIVEADPSLAGATDEIHALIESSIDVWLLWEKRGMSVKDGSCATALAHTERIDRCAGAMITQMAWEVFGMEIGPAEYGHAVCDYQVLYTLIDPPATWTATIAAYAERIVRRRSSLSLMAHTELAGGDCPLANLAHRLWRNPWTGERSLASFADLFHDALMAWPTFAQRLVEGDAARLRAMVGGVDYNGRVHEAE